MQVSKPFSVKLMFANRSKLEKFTHVNLLFGEFSLELVILAAESVALVGGDGEREFERQVVELGVVGRIHSATYSRPAFEHRPHANLNSALF